MFGTYTISTVRGIVRFPEHRKARLTEATDARAQPPRDFPDDGPTRTLRHAETLSADWDFLDSPELVWLVEEGENRAHVRVDWTTLESEDDESR